MDKAEIEIGFGDFEQLAAPLLAFSATFEPSLRRGLPAKPEVGRMAPDTNDDAIKILVGKKPL